MTISVRIPARGGSDLRASSFAIVRIPSVLAKFEVRSQAVSASERYKESGVAKIAVPSQIFVVNADIQDVLDKQTEAWGIKVSNVEIKRIDLNESMVRAIARQAEAERSRRAKIINAQGEQQAAQKLLDAAQILAPVPQAMQLRYLATLFDIASERSSTIVFPFPIDLITAATRR